MFQISKMVSNSKKDQIPKKVLNFKKGFKLKKKDQISKNLSNSKKVSNSKIGLNFKKEWRVFCQFSKTWSKLNFKNLTDNKPNFFGWRFRFFRYSPPPIIIGVKMLRRQTGAQLYQMFLIKFGHDIWQNIVNSPTQFHLFSYNFNLENFIFFLLFFNEKRLIF